MHDGVGELVAVAERVDDVPEVLVDESRRERTERMDELLARYVAKWLEFLESVELPYAWPPSSSDA